MNADEASLPAAIAYMRREADPLFLLDRTAAFRQPPCGLIQLDQAQSRHTKKAAYEAAKFVMKEHLHRVASQRINGV
jgi:hypothetical protein